MCEHEHHTMIKNRTLFCADNLDVMRGMNSQSVDLIYIDPPFNKNQMFIAPIGSDAEGAHFKDYWTQDDVKETDISLLKGTYPALYKYLQTVENIGIRGAKYYLLYIGVRLVEMRRLLKDTGSIYLHCDPTMSHYLKLLMDLVFGVRNYRNEITWWYRKFGQGDKNFKKNHDILLYYAKDSEKVFYKASYEDFSPKTQKDKYKRVRAGGRWIQDKRTPMDTIRKANGVVMSNTWEISFINSQSKERTGYPTQKPLALLKRIIAASSQEGDMVLDAFCGCATTCVAAENLHRQWIGIDLSKVAYDLVKTRLNKSHILYRTDIPKRADLGDTTEHPHDKNTLSGALR